VKTKLDVDTGVEVSAEDALRTFCYADALFRKRYTGWSVLGRGPWATVVKVRSVALGQDIALKVFVNLDPELLDRIRQEVRAVQALATPYIVSVYSLFDREALAWFEMELVDGPNLQTELDRSAADGMRLPLVRSYEIGLAVGRCLWHAHRHDVLHRDVKPANVLLPATGQPSAKLGDFGIARLSDVASITPKDAVVGTPRFASPEALAGEAVGPPHDIYSLGATLYALFSGGQVPYALTGANSIAELRRLQATVRPQSLRTLAADLDPDVSDMVMRSLAWNAAERPSPGEIVRTLERAQSRWAAAALRRGERHEVSISSWRIALTGLGLAALGIWARWRQRGGVDDDD
jgi:eukaryotic-like serine/threonine-protein kinase